MPYARCSCGLMSLRGCLGGEALPPRGEMHVVADFDVWIALDLLDGQPAATYELDPPLGVFSGPQPLRELHRVRTAEQQCHRGQIGRPQLAEAQPQGRVK